MAYACHDSIVPFLVHKLLIFFTCLSYTFLSIDIYAYEYMKAIKDSTIDTCRLIVIRIVIDSH